MTCRELVELVTDYLEGSLSPAQHARFDAHLDRCAGCRAYLEQLRQTIAAVGRLEEHQIEPVPRDALLAAFRDWRSRSGG
jgi:anti-sigma factor RsiW